MTKVGCNFMINVTLPEVCLLMRILPRHDVLNQTFYEHNPLYMQLVSPQVPPTTSLGMVCEDPPVFL